MRLIFILVCFLTGVIQLTAQEVCNDNMDNDNNGLTDCADPQCLCPDLFECSETATFYQVHDGRHFVEYMHNTLSFDTLHTNTYDVDAIGYNVQDGFIYGIKPFTNELIQIDRNGFFNMGTITGLPWPGNDSYIVGDMDLNGNLFVTHPNISDFYIVNIQNITAAGIAIANPWPSTDLIFNANDLLFYGLDSNNDLVSFNPVSSVISNPQSITDAPTCSLDFETGYADIDGGLYCYCSGNGDLFKVELTTMQGTLLQTSGIIPMSSDGASCPLSEALEIIPPVLVCDDGLQVSMEAQCTVEITHDMLLEGFYYPLSCLEVVIMDQNFIPIPSSPFVTEAYMDQILNFSVQDMCDGNSCWGTLTVEDKWAPIVDCPADLTVGCHQIDQMIPLPPATDNCQLQSISEASNTIEYYNCDPDFTAIRTILYQAIDASGNVSAICTTQVYYQKPSFQSIAFPVNYDNTAFPDLPGLPCSTNQSAPLWDLNGNGYPDPEETGYPTDPFGNPYIPGGLTCEAGAEFTDTRLDICDGSFKIFRAWELLDWCSGAFRHHTQIIKIEDVQDPIISCPSNMTLSTDNYSCFSNVIVPPPTVDFDCSNYTYTVSWLQGGVTDPCPPNSNGVFTDQGVVGNTSMGYTISGMTIGCAWIKYTVTDDCNNSSECVVPVTIVDLVAPIPVCKEFTTVTLGAAGWAHVFAQSFDNGSHDNCTDVAFGVRRIGNACNNIPNSPTPSIVFTNDNGIPYYQYQKFCCEDVGQATLEVELVVWDEYGNYNVCTVDITVQDIEKPTITCGPVKFIDCTDPVVFDSPVYNDNCGIVSIDSSDNVNIDNLCKTGFQSRQWTVTDAGGFTAQCSQTIFIQNQTPFDGSIQWPQDALDLQGCIDADTDPSVLGEPIFNGDICSSVASSHFDQVFSFVDDACFKILRNWTVIDWCQFDPDFPNGPGIWKDIQVIKVNDDSEPILDCSSSFLSITDGCSINDGVSISTMDDCGSLDIYYQIDFDNTGNYGPIQQGSVAQAAWNAGSHSVLWTVEDKCGNSSTCVQAVVATDDKLPSPYCLGQAVTVVMPTSGAIELLASSYDLGSFDNCDTELDFSFSSNVNQTTMMFDCTYLGENTIEIWVTDDAGNQDYCEVSLILQDNNGVCPDNINLMGALRTEELLPISNVTVNLLDLNDGYAYEHTVDSTFGFSNVPVLKDYSITASRNDVPMNGVSTLDLLFIQKHILGIDYLDSPYEYIAADINGDGNISAIDLIELRKLIIGIFSELPNNTSWRFVNAAFDFSDPTSPWPFEEEIVIEDFEGLLTDQDFVGVKIGDVNHSVTASVGNSQAESRTSDKLILEYEIIDDEILFYLNEDLELGGWQGTLCINEPIQDIVAGQIDFSKNQCKIDHDVLTVSWTNPHGQHIDSEDVLFSIKSEHHLDDLNISICEDGIATEIYEIQGVTGKVELRKRSTEDFFVLYQNEPNPFTSETIIQYQLSNEQEVVLTIFDLNGHVIEKVNAQGQEGINRVVLSTASMSKGIYYYELQSGKERRVKKMLKL